MISIVIPTYNESESIKPFLERVHREMSSLGSGFEIIVVDDSSPDRTADVVESLNLNNIRLVRRAGIRGLYSAMVRGMRESHGDRIGFMDADFSHPPGILPQLVIALECKDLAIASRYVNGGSVQGWSLSRRLTSYIARLLVRPLTNVRDPVSGFFMARREVLEDSMLRPRGFKMLPDILTGCKGNNAVELGYEFKPRKRGSSKFGYGDIWAFMVQVLELYVNIIIR
jgi:dolichol-phosphate mannosyltransferase